MSLEEAVTSIKTGKQCKAFLDVILSPNEAKSIRKRWEIFKFMTDGATQKRISEVVDVAPATVSRARRTFDSGKAEAVLKSVLGQK